MSSEYEVLTKLVKELTVIMNEVLRTAVLDEAAAIMMADSAPDNDADGNKYRRIYALFRQRGILK